LALADPDVGEPVIPCRFSRAPRDRDIEESTV
jgi:hypothetical protein